MTLKELNSVLTEAEDKTFNIIDYAMRGALERIETEIRYRIFNNNSNKKADGLEIGKYKSERYKEYRRSVGKQVDKIDLQLSDTLSRSIERTDSSKAWQLIIKPTNEPRVVIPPKKKKTSVAKSGSTITSDKLARHFDKTYGPIFYPSEKEKEICLETANVLFTEKFKEVLKLR